MKYCVEINKFINQEEGTMTLLHFKKFQTKKEAIKFIEENKYYDSTQYYTKLWKGLDYIIYER